MRKTIRKKHRYYVIKTICQDDIHAKCNSITYGIGSKNDSRIVVLDVSTDRKFVKTLVEKCNKANLSPIHLFDVIEDALP